MAVTCPHQPRDKEWEQLPSCAPCSLLPSLFSCCRDCTDTASIPPIIISVSWRSKQGNVIKALSQGAYQPVGRPCAPSCPGSIPGAAGLQQHSGAVAPAAPRARGEAGWGVTPAGVSVGQEGRMWGRRSPRCTCGRRQRRVLVSAALSDVLLLNPAALTLIGFDPSGPTLSHLGDAGVEGGTALSPCGGGTVRARGAGHSE